MPLFKSLQAAVLVLALVLVVPRAETAESTESPRAVLSRAIVSEDPEEQIRVIRSFVGSNDEEVSELLEDWRVSELYIYETDEGTRIPFRLEGDSNESGEFTGERIDNGERLVDANGGPLVFTTWELIPADTTAELRKAMSAVQDMFAMADEDPKVRQGVAIKLGQQRDPENLPYLQQALETESDVRVRRALDEAISLIRTVDPDEAVRNEAIRALGESYSVTSLSILQDMRDDAAENADEYSGETAAALAESVKRIENYIWRGNLVGTFFRGFSLAAVLLVAALGLAITFGLMGVINMAHGEVIAVGAYTAYVVQGLFGPSLMVSPLGHTVSIPGLGLSGVAFDLYFIVALIASFFTAGLVGLILERGVIRFLYKRPLESLLATWGVSLLMQQLFRHTFGAANVQVGSPAWLSGSFVWADILFAYNRLFVIAFAVFIVIGIWMLLTRTSLGLQIRAVMQNRAMASCMGVKTERVNMLTFAVGSGLAGMAGACLSQIANVGPSLGQSYLVDCFMIVVLGGIGSLAGTVTASLGVGVTDQILQPWLGAVMGKITVLAFIILFLQWRPSGIFVKTSRSLEG